MVMIVAKTLGVKTVCTEHSHFTYSDLGVIGMNKL